MGARPDDLLDFFGGDLGKSIEVDLTVVSAPSAKLLPRRYLIQFLDTAGNRVWALVGPFSATVPVVATAAVPSTPFAAGGPTAFELNVRPGFNDQIAAVMAAGTGKMIITPISRVAK